VSLNKLPISLSGDRFAPLDGGVARGTHTGARSHILLAETSSYAAQLPIEW